MAAAETTAKPRARKEVAFEPHIVHAYRRAPYMVSDNKGGLVEKDVEVVCHGEKIKFRSNEAGHIVGTVTSEPAYKRLVGEIPEAYIEYQGGENIPEARVEPAPEVPAGDFVLTNGKDSVVLDGMDDNELRAFALANGVDEIHDSLSGDVLRRAIYNRLTTG